ncbi:MAG: hypothetical protein VB130_12605, partial [Clostridium sp.]|nr:hypothetical protein [Clostridium sp.]
TAEKRSGRRKCKDAINRIVNISHAFPVIIPRPATYYPDVCPGTAGKYDIQPIRFCNCAGNA